MPTSTPSVTRAALAPTMAAPYPRLGAMRVLRFVLIALIVVLSTVVHVLPLLVVALIKAVLPTQRLRMACNPLLSGLAERWVGVNNWLWRQFTDTRLQLSGDAELQPDGHYLVLANHQSWVDILVLQKAFNRRIPLLRFFLKRQLFWVPLLGLAWWALDFPFMGRYSPKQIAKNPALAKRDIEATRRACAKFSTVPVAIMNFVEGTRFTPEKHAKQASPYQHLLKPKSGGVAFVLDAMGEGLHGILDVTICYPSGQPSLLGLLMNKVPEVQVVVRQLPIPPELMGQDYQNDREFRVLFQRWMNTLWQEKDATLKKLLGITP